MPASAPRSSAPRGAGPASLLPPELFYIYLIAPLLYSPLLIKNLFSFPLLKIARVLAAQYVPFLCIPAALHTVYRYLMPRWLASLPDPRWRPLLHAAVITLVTLSVGYPVHSLKCLINGSCTPLLPFLWTSVTFSFSFVLPALLIQDLRVRRKSAERVAAAEQKARLEMQLQALQARTNPHFLFNSLNTAASLIHDDPALAEQTIERMASLLRYSLECGDTRMVSLSREVQVVTDYLAVQRARFGHRLRAHLEIDDAAASAPVPPMCLQPLVENAVLHGVAPRRGGATIQVTARCLPGVLLLEVQDDGSEPIARQAQHQGTGSSLRDLRARLRLLYGERATLLAGPVPGGFRARVTLPWSAPR